MPRPSPRDARHSSTADAWDKVAARLQDVDQTSTSGQDWLPEEPPSAPAPRRTHFGGHSREGHTPRRYPAHTGEAFCRKQTTLLASKQVLEEATLATQGALPVNNELMAHALAVLLWELAIVAAWGMPGAHCASHCSGRARQLNTAALTLHSEYHQAPHSSHSMCPMC